MPLQLDSTSNVLANKPESIGTTERQQLGEKAEPARQQRWLHADNHSIAKNRPPARMPPDHLKRNGHKFAHVLGRAGDGSKRRMFAVNFDDATRERISKADPKHTRGVINVDGKGNAGHSSGKKARQGEEVSEAEPRTAKNSFRDKTGHYVIW
jgi:hypothetical protein